MNFWQAYITHIDTYSMYANRAKNKTRTAIAFIFISARCVSSILFHDLLSFAYASMGVVLYCETPSMCCRMKYESKIWIHAAIDIRWWCRADDKCQNGLPRKSRPIHKWQQRNNATKDADAFLHTKAHKHTHTHSQMGSAMKPKRWYLKNQLTFARRDYE